VTQSARDGKRGGQRGHYCSDAAASFDGDGRRDNDSGDEVITARPCKMVNGQGAAQGAWKRLLRRDRGVSVICWTGALPPDVQSERHVAQ
jgi:hypothetical protein